MKLGEFLALNQGTKTVTQYLHAFNNLCRYAPDMVDTDAKKIASFKRGLGPKMMKHMGTNTRARFNDFISDCLKQEKNNNAYTTSKTRKRAFESRRKKKKKEPLSHDRHSQELSLLIVRPIARLHQVQGLGHRSIRPRIKRDRRSRTRWQCRQRRQPQLQDKVT
jgi:hypothetical protein